MPLIAHIASRLEIKEVWGEAPKAERRPVARCAGIRVRPQPRLQIEIRRDGPAVKELVLAIFNAPLPCRVPSDFTTIHSLLGCPGDRSEGRRDDGADTTSGAEPTRTLIQSCAPWTLPPAVVAGVTTCVCVSSTVGGGVENNYRMILVSDGAEVSRETHASELKTMDRIFADVRVHPKSLSVLTSLSDHQPDGCPAIAPSRRRRRHRVPPGSARHRAD